MCNILLCYILLFVTRVLMHRWNNLNMKLNEKKGRRNGVEKDRERFMNKRRGHGRLDDEETRKEERQGKEEEGG